MFIENIVIGKPIVDPSELLEDGWEDKTLFTEDRFLPRVLKEAGIVQSTSEVKRNRPELVKKLNNLDCFWVKWGKRFVYIIVGE